MDAPSRPAVNSVALALILSASIAAVFAMAGCDGCGPKPPGPGPGPDGDTIRPPEPPPVLELTEAVTVPVADNMARLLEEEDTDGDKKITIDDPRLDGGRGDREFVLKGGFIGGYDIQGTYYLSNLLQELALAAERGEDEAEIDPDRIRENALDRTSRLIREQYWDNLTRSVDEASFPGMFDDPKMGQGDSVNYLYIPADDPLAERYFNDVAARHPEWNMEVVKLPGEITPEYVRDLGGRHGILSLALEELPGGSVRGVPFVAPGGRFNEMYGWDSYFEALGLLADGRVDLARSMVDNFVYQIEHYGKILNANRTYYLTRSQPPFLTSMAIAVYQDLPPGEDRDKWMADVLRAAINEYERVWTAPPRGFENGLSRYFGEGIGPCPEVEKGHYDPIVGPYAREQGVTAEEYIKGYLEGAYKNDDLAAFFVHDRAVRESGHDTTYRFDDRTTDFLAVDLNSLLYKYEIDIAWIMDEVFGGNFEVEPGRVDVSGQWRRKAASRKGAILHFMTIQEDLRGENDKELMSGYFDYDLRNGRRSDYLSAASFYPLWAGLAEQAHADYMVRVVLPLLEQPGGVAASDLESRGPVGEARPPRQWDYPYGWAPHQMLIWEGLRKYGHDAKADRLAYKWLYTIAKNAADYNGTVPEKFDVVKRSHQVFVEYGNVGTDFDYITKEGFGWMNASFQVGQKGLPGDLKEKLRRLVPPEEAFAPEKSAPPDKKRPEPAEGDTAESEKAGAGGENGGGEPAPDSD